MTSVFESRQPITVSGFSHDRVLEATLAHLGLGSWCIVYFRLTRMGLAP